MTDILEHIKGSEIPKIMASRIRPNRYYKITLEVEGSEKDQELAAFQRAIRPLEGVWENRPEKEAEMIEVRKEFDRPLE